MSYGLVYPPDFLASLNSLLDRPKPFPPVRALSDLQFIQVHAKHLLQMGSQGIDSTLFPYLHGIEYGGPNIREYFCRSHKNSSCIHPSLANPSNAGEGGGPDSTCPSCSRLLCVPDYRGLIWVSDDGNEDIDDDGLEDEMLVDDDELDFSRPSDISIQSSPSSYSLLRKSTSASIIPSLASRTVTSLKTTMSDDSTADTYSSQTLAMMHIRGSFKVPEILSSSENRFVIPKPPDGVSLRNFEIQVSAYARVSDVILYSSRGRGITSSLLSLANRFCEAHEALYRERSNQGQNPPLYNVFLLDCIPSQLPRHFLCSYPSFADIECREMQTFTSASQILPGIFLGNSADVPSWSNSECTTNVFENKNNPHGYDLVVECVDEKLVAIPTSSHIKKAEDHLSTLQSLWATGFMSTPPQRPPPNAHSILHLLFPCSPSAQTPLQHIIAFISFIQSLIHPVHGSRRCKILIYCQDGYTETSVLALTLLMAERKCSLPEAYLDLQTKKDRSFFVHGSDIPLLQKLQGKYHSSPQFGSLGRSTLGWSRNRERDRWPWSGFGKSDHSGPSEKEGIGSLGIKFGRRSSSQLNGSPRENHGIWFQNPKFDGSLPSRILPFLYLGNLNHAQNAQMLHSLDITHVVSVGESALVPPDDPSSSGAFTLWSEEREGRLKVLDVKNILDDGMDGLGGQLSPICDWMDEARKSGGKVLVHCRVGVSRSATVTIAYVMRHLSLSLADAYLLVRSRRLSVLIQPNIRLLFDLLGWEVHLARERIKSKLGRLPMDWPMMEQDSAIINTVEEMVLKELNQALCWPYLAREIYKLNAKYIR